MTATPSAPITCEGALSDAVLQAARAAVAAYPGNPYANDPWQHCGPRNQPLLTLLDALADAGAAVAGAIQDNCQADCLPVPAASAKGLAQAFYLLGDVITAAAAAPEPTGSIPLPPGWSLPSVTGKELV